MHRNKHFLTCLFSLLLIFAIIIGACRQKPQIPSNIPAPDEEKENLIALNKAIIDNETKAIKDYISKKNLSLTEDSLGFWCSAALQNRKNTAKSEQTITYQYSITLLDGTPCYSNLNSNRRTTIRLGKGESFAGLDMALRKMHIGEQADFIFPSILAYGVSGDGHRIPPYSSLICRVKLISYQK